MFVQVYNSETKKVNGIEVPPEKIKLISDVLCTKVNINHYVNQRLYNYCTSFKKHNYTTDGLLASTQNCLLLLRAPSVKDAKQSAREWFTQQSEDFIYEITNTSQHYNCMVDGELERCKVTSKSYEQLRSQGLNAYKHPSFQFNTKWQGN